MRDNKWLINIVGIVILVSAICMGVKKAISFLLDVIIGLFMALMTYAVVFILIGIVNVVVNSMLIAVNVSSYGCDYGYVSIFMVIAIISMILVFLGSIIVVD